MNKYSIIFIILLISCQPLCAVQYITDKTIIVDEPVYDDIYLTGRQVEIAAPVYGDITIKAGKVVILRSIDGDASISASEITIQNEIKGDARLIGGNVRFTSTAIVRGHTAINALNVICMPGAVFGEDITINSFTTTLSEKWDREAPVAFKDMYISSVFFNVYGTAMGNIHALDELQHSPNDVIAAFLPYAITTPDFSLLPAPVIFARINDNIKGDLNIHAVSLRFGPAAVIRDNFVFACPKIFRKTIEAKVSRITDGKIVYDAGLSQARALQCFRQRAAAAAVLFFLLFIGGMILLALIPSFAGTAITLIEANPVKTILIGSGTVLITAGILYVLSSIKLMLPFVLLLGLVVIACAILIFFIGLILTSLFIGRLCVPAPLPERRKSKKANPHYWQNVFALSIGAGILFVCLLAGLWCAGLFLFAAVIGSGALLFADGKILLFLKSKNII